MVVFVGRVEAYSWSGRSAIGPIRHSNGFLVHCWAVSAMQM